MLRKISIVFLIFINISSIFAQNRSFNDIFPQISDKMREKAFSGGFIGASEGKWELKATSIGNIDQMFVKPISVKGPSVLIESLEVIPFTSNPVELLTVYNSLRRISALKGRLYHSATRNEDIPLFEEATRIESAKRTNALPDAAVVSIIPASETVYIRLKDVNFGNSFYRGEISMDTYGLKYRLSNFRNLTYLFIPVIKEEKFIAQFYFEILEEGILIYGIAYAEVSDFVSSKIDMPSAISKRLEVISSWIKEGINILD